MNQSKRNRVEAFSRLVFGSKHRLLVLVTVARSEPGVIYAKQIAQDSGVPSNVVGSELKKLVEAGVLDQINEFAGGGRQVLYQRREHAIWDLVERVEADVLSPNSDQTGSFPA